MINTTRCLSFLLVIAEQPINLKSVWSHVSLAPTFIPGDQEAVFIGKSILSIVVNTFRLIKSIGDMRGEKDFIKLKLLVWHDGTMLNGCHSADSSCLKNTHYILPWSNDLCDQGVFLI